MDPIEPSRETERNRVLEGLRTRILAFARSRFAGEIAEDLAQEVLLLLQEKYPQVHRLEDLLPLSFQILHFKLIAWRRQAARQSEGEDVENLRADHPDPEEWAARKESLDRLKAALLRLGERCQSLFRLKLEGRSFPEIQSLLGAASLNTVYTWDSRCRKDLLARMGGRWR